MACNFIFCLHNHQPVGNFDHILKWAFQDCYEKIIEIFKEYPEFRFAIHHSGPILEWIKDNHPEYLHTLKEMAAKGQAEIIGGGFYEPIFSIISENDIHGQIALMQNFCKRELGVSPKGFWTAERVWDPEIPNLVSGFNLDYTILDDIHFRYAGIDEEDLNGYFITERLEKKLMVFPIDKSLRYAIPFKMPVETINYFKSKIEKSGDGVFLYGDDGEKFGLWPNTFKWVFEEKWLRNFIEAILKEDWIKTTHPSEYIATHAPLGRVYLTQGSYFELSEWALPSKAAQQLIRINSEIKSLNRENEFYPFLKGGVWNNFLMKYPESNAINKRTILLSKEIELHENKTGNRCIAEKTELYKSECNCAYWHGLFGGIYLNHLRHGLYEHILKSESIFLKRKKLIGISITEEDLWNEGQKQILIRKKDQSTMIVPYMGGTISELGVYKKAFNIFNTLARRHEAYHELLKELKEESETSDNNGNNYNQNKTEIASIHDIVKAKEKNLKRYLSFDQTRRYSFKDILLKQIPSPEDMMSGNAEKFDLTSLEYNYSIRKEKNKAIILLTQSISFQSNNISINKKFIINERITGVGAQYNLTDIGNLLFGVEFNINLLSAHDDDRYYEIPGVSKAESYLDVPGIHYGIKAFSLIDNFNKFKITISSSIEASLLKYPIYTISQSDSGFEKNYQGSCLILIYDSNKTKGDFSIDLFIE